MSKIKSVEELRQAYNDVEVWPDLYLTPETVRFCIGAMEHVRRATLNEAANKGEAYVAIISKVGMIDKKSIMDLEYSEDLKIE